MAQKVCLVEDIDFAAVRDLLGQLGLNVVMIDIDQDIPGSFWGNPEAGLIGENLYLRLDTPIHSVLHEASHWICMDEQRRQYLHTDAGGDAMEECAVNYLQIYLAEQLQEVGKEQMLNDMDVWQYSYREGQVRDWLKGDAAEALQWLQERQILQKVQLLLNKSK